MIVEVELQVANQTIFELFHHDTDLRFLRIASDVLKSNYFILMVHCHKLELILVQFNVLEVFKSWFVLKDSFLFAVDYDEVVEPGEYEESVH